MSTQRNIRQQKREAQSDPINYTCGKCHQVHTFNKDHPYVCECDIVALEESE